MASSPLRPLRAVQVSFHSDARRRDPMELLAAWPVLVQSSAAIARAGVDVHVVQAAHRRATFEHAGATYHFVDDTRALPVRLFGPIRVPRRPTRLIAQIASLEPDVIHVHGLNFPLAIRQLAGHLPHVPILAQDHGAAAPSGWRRMAHRWAYERLDGVAFTTCAQSDPFLLTGVLRRDQTGFEILGGSSAFTPGDVNAARAATGMRGSPCFLWTGRLDANKDPMTALAAFERAALALPNARLWCCYGAAPLLDAVRARIDDSPVMRDRVTIVGTRPAAEMELWFRGADFFVQTSRREASGFSLLEALACGATPLVTDIPAARRIVGDAGSLTSIGDAPQLAEAMVDWASRTGPELRRAARARFDEALAFDVVGREARAAYDEVIRRRRLSAIKVVS